MRRGIDHIVLCVADLETSAAFYRKLGFITTPRAQHPWGTDNSLIQLKGSFLELLTVSRPAIIPQAGEKNFSFGAFNQEFLSHREGISMLVFESTDAGVDREEFISRGLHPYDKFHFERFATLPDQSRVPVAFTLAFAMNPRMPEAGFFSCQQHAPQHFWKTEYQSHANGAEALKEVIMVADKPSAYADFFTKIQEPDSVDKKGERLTVRTPRGIISMITPEDADRRYSALDLSNYPESPFFLGFVVQTIDSKIVTSHLRTNNIPFETSTRSIRVYPNHAFGALIEFQE